MATNDDMRARLGDLSPASRERFEARLRGARKISDASRRAATIARLETEVEKAVAARQARAANAPDRISFPAELPITDRRADIMQAIRDHQVVVVAGETGSGKSTQLPKMCLELGRGVDGIVGHTQPRRIAARSIAERVAEELGTSIGGLVGYTVRFTDEVTDRTMVKVMTDGILLNEVQRDRLLSRYDTIIIDEAHERSLNIDFLLGYLTQLLPRRPDLKVIITSATIDTQRFSDHFDGAPVVEVSGRTYPVEIRYRPLVDPSESVPKDQAQGICDAVEELYTEGDGDILVFCSGEREIRDAVDALGEMDLRHTEILPLYGRLSAGEQHRVFSRHTGRRIVVSTNVAETSLTVPGIRYVVDAGTARISRYSRRTKVQRLPIEPISQASADQRSGRCGRLGPGVAIRLYAEEDYVGRPEFTDPEILRTSLASVILQMAAVGLGDIEGFPFIEAPDTRSIRDGRLLLEELGAVDAAHAGTGRWLTPLGRRLARLPLDPRLGRMVLEADTNGCLREVLIIVAGLSIQDPRERPTGQEEKARSAHRRFADPQSDFVSWLHMWDHITRERRDRSTNQFRRMCRDEFLNYRRIREWQDVHGQLRRLADEMKMRRNTSPADAETIHKTLLAGLLSRVGMKDPDSHQYRGARGARFSISPASVHFKANPPWVMAAELVETTRMWAHATARLEPVWIEQVGAHLVKRSYSDPWWDADRGSAVAREAVSIFGLPLTTDRDIQYDRVDPGAARELFIRHVLVGAEWDREYPFVEHNKARIREVLALQDRGRRRDLLADDSDIEAVFAERIPDDIVTVRHFDRWWREVRDADPHRLHLSTEDLLDADAAEIDDEAFPDQWRFGDLDLPLSYEFDPDSPDDGMTVHLPVGTLDRIDPEAFDWLVPGFRRELIETLIRNLPKHLRKPLLPIAETVDHVVETAQPGDGSLVEVVRGRLMARTGLVFLPDAFDFGALPPHLRPRFDVHDESGESVAAGSDLRELRADLQRQVRNAVASSSHDLERSGVVAWDFGDLPRAVQLGDETAVTAFPALCDEGDGVAIRLLATEAEQSAEMWAGVRRLLLLRLPAPTKLLRSLLDNDAALAVAGGPHESVTTWMDDCLIAALDQIIDQTGLPWNAVDFDELSVAARDQLADRLATIGRESLEVLAAYRRVESAAPAAAGHEDVLADIGEQVGRLLYPGFVAGLTAERMPDVRRYLEAVERRLGQVPQRPDRDRMLMAEVRALEAEFDGLVDQLPWSPKMIDISWMLQEFRVSQFAQVVGVKGSVSAKRIRAAMRELV